MATQLDRIEEKLNTICEWINGNGKPGAKVRLDRLERALAVLRWGVAIVIVALAGAGAHWLFG